MPSTSDKSGRDSRLPTTDYRQEQSDWRQATSDACSAFELEAQATLAAEVVVRRTYHWVCRGVP